MQMLKLDILIFLVLFFGKLICKRVLNITLYLIVLISILIFFVSAQKIVKGLEKYPLIKKLDNFFSRKKM